MEVCVPRLMRFLRMKCIMKKLHLARILKGCPVATYNAVVRNNGLEDAAVVMGQVPVLRWKHNVPALIADEVFVVRRNQKKPALSETSCAAIFRQV